MLLAEYAITPDVFDPTSYPHSEVCELQMRQLKEVLLTEGVVRDLRDGEWRALFAAVGGRSWNRKALELLRKLKLQKRLVLHEPVLDRCPTDDTGWCAEAVATHEVMPLTGGIIVTEQVKAAFDGNDLVARIDRLASVPWWANRSPSVRLHRDVDDYARQLGVVLRYANSIMFIDPHLDPKKRQYRDFGELLSVAADREPPPVIEIHRVCYEGSGPNRSIHDDEYFRERFRSGFAALVQDEGVKIEVFIWDDFHDRYLISDLVGISIPYGFDTTTDQNSRTTWTRLGRGDRDDVQREFDPATGRHKLHDRFTVR